MPDFPITANDRYFIATAIAAQTVFTPDFPLFDETELIVKRTRASVTTTLVLTTHYTISGLSQEAGFTCTLTAGAQVGDVLEFFGNTALMRQSDYPASQALRTAALNADLDRAVMRDQEARRDIEKLDVEGDVLDARDQAVAAAASAMASASAASSSQAAAAGSAGSASTSATNAGNSAAAASGSQTAAAGSANSASTSATNAGNSATAASGSAGTATTQAGNAAASASSASTAATNAVNARVAAEAARDATLAAFDSFDDRYLGPKASDPTLDNDGAPLAGGMLYFNTVSGIIKIYNGTAWVAAYVDGSGLVAKAGDTMTGPLTLPGDPTVSLHAATKQYVDTGLGAKAPLASPAFTGNPTAVTQSQADDSTKLATTAYVRAAIAAVLNGVSSAFDTLAEIATALAGKVDTTRTVTASTGLTGGGDLSANRSFAIDKASDANVRAAASNKVLTADLIASASAFVALGVVSNNVALDWASGVNFTLMHTANFTLQNPSNVQAGTWRTIKITQHTTGGQTIAFGNQYKAAGGVSSIVLSTGNSAVDCITLFAETATSIWVFLGKDMKA